MFIHRCEVCGKPGAHWVRSLGMYLCDECSHDDIALTLYDMMEAGEFDDNT